VTLDLKGYQYDGMIHPGPTAMILALRGGELKVDAMTDEFVSLAKTIDVMAKLNAVVQGSMDASYNIVDDDINKRNHNPVPIGGQKCRAENNLKATGAKRKASSGSGGGGGGNSKTTPVVADTAMPQEKKRTLQSRKKIKSL
jgi:hypothetical protein